MKLEMTSTWIPILQPGLYGTSLGNTFEQCYDDDMTNEEFKKQLCHSFESVMNEIFNEDPFAGTPQKETDFDYCSDDS